MQKKAALPTTYPAAAQIGWRKPDNRHQARERPPDTPAPPDVRRIRRQLQLIDVRERVGRGVALPIRRGDFLQPVTDNYSLQNYFRNRTGSDCSAAFADGES